LITSELLEAYLACPTKCYLRLMGEADSENTYATWTQTRNESYRREGIERLAASSSQELAGFRTEPGRLKEAQWQLAFSQVFQAEDLEASIHAVQRIPRRGKAQSSDFIPFRFVRANKPSRTNRITAGFDALVLSKLSGQPVGVAKIIHGDNRTEITIRADTVRRELTKVIIKVRRLLEHFPIRLTIS
jgi:hypothetical protein